MTKSQRTTRAATSRPPTSSLPLMRSRDSVTHACTAGWSLPTVTLPESETMSAGASGGGAAPTMASSSAPVARSSPAMDAVAAAERRRAE